MNEPKEPLCGDCGKELTLVRPGKHQCDNEDCVQNKKSESQDKLWDEIFEVHPFVVPLITKAYLKSKFRIERIK